MRMKPRKSPKILAHVPLPVGHLRGDHHQELGLQTCGLGIDRHRGLCRDASAAVDVF